MRKRVSCRSKSFTPCGNIAVARLHLPDGNVLHNQILHFDEEGYLLSYENLNTETPQTKWLRGDVRIVGEE